MNGPGRAIHAAVWSMGGQFGPGGSIAVNSTTRPLPLRGPRGYDAAKGPERRWGADRTVFGLDSGVPRCPADAPPQRWKQEGRSDSPARATRVEHATRGTAAQAAEGCRA